MGAELKLATSDKEPKTEDGVVTLSDWKCDATSMSDSDSEQSLITCVFAIDEKKKNDWKELPIVELILSDVTGSRKHSHVTHVEIVEPQVTESETTVEVKQDAETVEVQFYVPFIATKEDFTAELKLRTSDKEPITSDGAVTLSDWKCDLTTAPDSESEQSLITCVFAIDEKKKNELRELPVVELILSDVTGSRKHFHVTHVEIAEPQVTESETTVEVKQDAETIEVQFCVPFI